MAVSGNSEQGAEGGLVRSASNVLGLAIAGFVGALNVIGLSSGELQAVLRNEESSAALISVPMFVALCTALGSLAVTQSAEVPWIYAVGIVAGFLSGFGFTTALTPVPGATVDSAWAIGIALAATAFLLLLLGLARTVFLRSRDAGDDRKRIPWKIVLISCSVIALSSSVWAAARVEVRSQVSATYPQLAADIRTENGVSELSMQIEAAKLKNGDQVRFTVQGYPRSGKGCGTAWEGKCIEQLCHDKSDSDPCSFIGTGIINSDSLGRVKQKIATPFSPRDFKLLVVEAYACEMVKFTYREGGEEKSYRDCKSWNKQAILYLYVAGQ